MSFPPKPVPDLIREAGIQESHAALEKGFWGRTKVIMWQQAARETLLTWRVPYAASHPWLQPIQKFLQADISTYILIVSGGKCRLSFTCAECKYDVVLCNILENTAGRLPEIKLRTA
jgi:hypothetical protein